MSCPKADLGDCYEKIRGIVEARKGVAWSASAVIAGNLSCDSFEQVLLSYAVSKHWWSDIATSYIYPAEWGCLVTLVVWSVLVWSVTNPIQSFWSASASLMVNLARSPFLRRSP